MRDIFFLLVSLALHGAMLGHPFVTLRPQLEEAMPVVFVTLARASESVGEWAATVEDKGTIRGKASARGSPGDAGAKNGTTTREDGLTAGARQRASQPGEERRQAQDLNAGSHKVQPKEELARKPRDDVAIIARPTETPASFRQGSATSWENTGRVINDLSPPSLGERQTAIEDGQADPGTILPGETRESQSLQFVAGPSETDDDPLKIHGTIIGLGGGSTVGARDAGGSGATSSTYPQVSGGGGGDSASGGGLESGSGFGGGLGSGSERLQFVQVSYAHTPRPEYPEQARREGREGRVLLRVRIDERGRSQSAEVHETSGSEILDLAAVEAIKRWRFRPARYGNEAVESWVKIPIHFRLSQANQ